MAGRSAELPERQLDFLRWLAAGRNVAFHGSQRGDLERLEPIRSSRDATEWGDQQALYASSDPVWAIYFACLRRDGGWSGTRNGSLGRVGGPLYPRSYFFAHNRGSASPDRFGRGRSMSCRPTRSPRIAVSPADFPFAGRIAYYPLEDPLADDRVDFRSTMRFGGNAVTLP